MRRKNIIRLVLLIFILTITLNSCKKKNDYFDINEQILFFEAAKKVASENKTGQYRAPILKKTLLFPQNCYTKLVIILDSCDKVYIYQTETIDNPEFQIVSDSMKYSNYIDLRPEHLMTFSSNGFINFIKDNHDIFELDSTKNDSTVRFITVASNQDIIRNEVFYYLKHLVSMYLLGPGPNPETFPIKSNTKAFHSICVVRKTTEEENIVIHYKKMKLKYNPETIKWSKNFINGGCRPFSKDYDSLEKKIENKQKAIFGIMKLSQKIKYIQ